MDKNSNNLTQYQQQQLHKLLEDYATIFQTSKSLPPHRIQDHRIPLIHGSKPPNNRPYRYGPVQKAEIEKYVAELLEIGIYKSEKHPIFFSSYLSEKKRRNLAYVHGLQRL